MYGWLISAVALQGNVDQSLLIVKLCCEFVSNSVCDRLLIQILHLYSCACFVGDRPEANING